MHLVEMRRVGEGAAVTVRVEGGRLVGASFPDDPDPSDDAIIAAVLAAEPRRLIGTSKAAREHEVCRLRDELGRELRALTALEAAPLPDAVAVAAQQGRVDAARNAYAEAVKAWATATDPLASPGREDEEEDAAPRRAERRASKKGR